MWRIRGEAGYGGFWGMMAVGQVFCLFLFSLFGTRGKGGPGIYLVSVVLLAATVGGWGTLNTQITGLLDSGQPFPGENEPRTVPVSPLSGIVLMFCLGFGWASLFAFFMGRFFGPGPLRGRGVGLALLVYAGASLFGTVFLAPPLLARISPPAVALFAEGLAATGAEEGVRGYHLWNAFGKGDPQKAIPGGRNYFASVDALASAFAALALWTWVRFVRRDRTAARVMLGVSLSFALAITLADLWLFWSSGGFRKAVDPPAWVKGWELWEFTTGLLAGLGMMFVFLRTETPDKIPTPPMGSRLRGALVLALAVFLFHIPLARAIVQREPGLPPHFVSLVSLIVLAMILVPLVGRFLRRGAVNRDFARFARTAFPIALGLHLLVYLFAGPEAALRKAPDVVTAVMLAATAVALGGYRWVLRDREEAAREIDPVG